MMAKTKPPRPPGLTTDERRCLEQLEDWEDEIRELVTFIGPATLVARVKHDPRSGAWAAASRTRLETLKRELGAEASRLALLDERRGLSAAESTYYARTVQRVSASLTLTVRSTDGEEWRQQLAAALVHLGLPLFRLRAKRDASTE